MDPSAAPPIIAPASPRWKLLAITTESDSGDTASEGDLDTAIAPAGVPPRLYTRPASPSNQPADSVAQDQAVFEGLAQAEAALSVTEEIRTLARQKREIEAAQAEARCAEEAASVALEEARRTAPEAEAERLAQAQAEADRLAQAAAEAERLAAVDSKAAVRADLEAALQALEDRGLDVAVDEFLSEAFSRRDPTIVTGLQWRATRDGYGEAAGRMIKHNLHLVDVLSEAFESGRVEALKATYDAMRLNDELLWVKSENALKVKKAIKRIPKVRLPCSMGGPTRPTPPHHPIPPLATARPAFRAPGAVV